MATFGAIENDVLFGRDNELFLASGGHQVIEFATGARPIQASSVNTFIENITSRKNYAKSRTKTYHHVIFPDKQSVLSEQFVTTTPVRLGSHYLNALPDSSQVIYPLDELRSVGRKSYMRTDTHMTDLGVILVVAKLAQEIKQTDVAADQRHLLAYITTEREHSGDLGTKLSQPQHSVERFAETPWRRLWVHNEIPGGNNGGVDIYVSPDARYKERLLWFGDSFGRQAARFLSFFFSEIVFLRTPYFHAELVDAIQPDHLITENVERYLGNCLSDHMRPSFHMFPFLGDREYKPSVHFAEAFSAMLSYPRPPYRQFIDKTLLALREPR